MRRCAVIGSPIAHSLSPLLHRAAYARLGIADQFSYDAIEVSPETLADFVASLGSEWVGLSVTAPNKEALLAHGQADEIAAALRAGNTLIMGRDGAPNRIYNTDVTGLLAALGRIGIQQASTAILIGAGATARSALWAASRLGVREAVVSARDAGRAQTSLADLADRIGVELSYQPFGRPITPPRSWQGRADLLFSTVPVRLPVELADAFVAQSSVVFEVVYNHYPSALDSAATKAGVPSLDGLDLLVGQAIDQIRLMTGREADPEPLLAACRAEVLRRQQLA